MALQSQNVKLTFKIIILGNNFICWAIWWLRHQDKNSILQNGLGLMHALLIFIFNIQPMTVFTSVCYLNLLLYELAITRRQSKINVKKVDCRTVSPLYHLDSELSTLRAL